MGARRQNRMRFVHNRFVLLLLSQLLQRLQFSMSFSVAAVQQRGARGGGRRRQPRYASTIVGSAAAPDDDSSKASGDDGDDGDSSAVTRLSRSAFLSSLLVMGLPVVVLATNPVAAAAAVPANRENADAEQQQQLPLLSSLAVENHRSAGDSKDSNSNKNNARQESVSGFVAGAALTLTKTLAKYPMDTATVRLQMPDSCYSLQRLRDLPALFANSYVGMTGPLLANVPAGAVFFAVKDAVRASLSGGVTASSTTANTLISVAVAQIPYWIIRNPSEVVKTRQQAGRLNYSSNGTTIVQAYQQVRKDAAAAAAASNTTTTRGSSEFNHWDAYYTGYWENVLYAYPADVLKFLCYEWLVEAASSSGGDGRSNGNRLPPAEGALYGAVATALAQLVTTPLDVVRNRVMANTSTATTATTTTATTASSDSNGDPAAATTNSYIESLVKLANEEGLTGLFAGAAPRVAKALVSGAIQFATYEETKQEIGKLFSRPSEK